MSRIGSLSDVRRVIAFGADLKTRAGGRLWPALGFLVLGSLTEGLSILLLVPLLAFVEPGSTVLRIPAERAPFLTNDLTFDLATALAVITMVIVLQSLLMRKKLIYMATITKQIVVDIRLSLFDAIGQARWRYLSSLRQADLQRALTADVDRVELAITTFSALFQTLFMLAVYGVVSLIISPMMTLIAMAIGVAFLVLLTPISRRSSAYGKEMTEQQTLQFRTIDAMLGGLKVIKSLNAEARYVSKLRQASEDWLTKYRRYLAVASMSGSAFQILSAFGVSIFAYIALAIIQMPVSAMIVMIVLFMRVAPKFNAVQDFYQAMLVNLRGYDEIQEFVRQSSSEAELTDAEVAAPQLKKMLTFQKVRFGYGEGDPVVPCLSLAIPAGRISAVIGPSGGGKSTMGDLVLGLLEPDEGAIEIDGEPLKGDALRAWRKTVAYVPQDVFLMHDTIRENLRIATPDADDDAIWAALTLAQAATFVRGLDRQLDTVVGPRGTRLSGGERQRIALARALLMKPQLLILDEATSALDWENQSLIARAIEGLRGQMTIITIAHRASMISFADWVLSIDHGRLVEAGPFKDLASKPESLLARLLDAEGLRR